MVFSLFSSIRSTYTAHFTTSRRAFNHYQPNVIRAAAKEQVIVFCLPPHTSHNVIMTQPLDSSCFGALKRAWVDECYKYVIEHPGRVVTRYKFSQMFHKAWVRAMTIVNVTSGFQATGVYPFSRTASSNLKPSESPFNPGSLAKKWPELHPPLQPISRMSRRKSALCTQFR